MKSLFLILALWSAPVTAKESDTFNLDEVEKCIYDSTNTPMGYGVCIAEEIEKADILIGNVGSSIVKIHKAYMPKKDYDALLESVTASHMAFKEYRQNMNVLYHLHIEGSIRRLVVPRFSYDMTVDHLMRLFEMCTYHATGQVTKVDYKHIRQFDLSKTDWCDNL